MFDTSKVGESLPPFTIDVERGKIHELAVAIGDPNPIFHDCASARAAGYADVPLFPTAPTMFWFWGNKKLVEQLTSLGLDVTRILHSGEEYEYLVPIYAGDSLTGVTTVAEGRVRRNIEMVTLVIEYTNQHGQLVLRARETLITR
jgi:N-terminal half of MaoC dehydratase